MDGCLRECVCMCVYMYRSMDIAGVVGVKSASAHICFTFVFHRYFIMDGWRLACVCVYVCAHVHIYVYCLCGRVEG